MYEFVPDKTKPILVKFELAPGVHKIGFDPFETIKKSAEAVDSAMNLLYAMADRVRSVAQSMTEPAPDVELEFGIVLDSEVGAFIAKAGLEASILVTLSWKRESQHS